MNSIFKSPYRNYYISGLFVFLITAFFSEGYFHPDEHFQLLEFCNYKLGLSPASELPWEFHEQIRPALQPFLAFAVIKLLMVVNVNDPFVWALLLRILTAIFAWLVLSGMSLYLLKDFTSDIVKKIFLLLCFFLWFLPAICVRFSSENYGGLTYLLAVCFLVSALEKKNKLSHLFCAGLFLGLSFFFRFQMGFAILGLGLWLIFVKKLNRNSLFIIIASGLTGMLISIIADYIFYGNWILTPWNYFHENIIAHRASDFGVSPWWHYFKMFIESALPPISIVLLILFLIGILYKSKHLLTWCIVPFIIGHMLVSHKEMRFMFPMVIPFIFLAAQGIAYLVGFGKYRTGMRIVFILCLVINIPVLVINSLIPARDSICYFKFLYHYNPLDKIELLSTKNIYEIVGLKVNFYRSKNVESIVLPDTNAQLEYLNIHQPDSIYVLQQDLKENISYPGYEKETIYCLFPNFVLKNNFNHWQERARFWKILKLKKLNIN